MQELKKPDLIDSGHKVSKDTLAFLRQRIQDFEQAEKEGKIYRLKDLGWNLQ